MVLLPVSLPQLKDPINGIFREGLELAYDRSLRPNHADELRELVQDPNSKTEIVFFLDAYDGRLSLPPKFSYWPYGAANTTNPTRPADPHRLHRPYRTH